MNLTVSRFNATPIKSIYTRGLTKNNSIQTSNYTDAPKTSLNTYNEFSSKLISFAGSNILIGVPKTTDKTQLEQRANYAKAQTQEALKINSELKGINDENMKLMQDVIGFVSKIDIKSSEEQSVDGVNITKTKRINPLTTHPIFEMSEPKYGISEFSAQENTFFPKRVICFNKDGARYTVTYNNCPEAPWITDYKITRESQNKNGDGITITTDEYNMLCNDCTLPVTIKRTIEERTGQNEEQRLISSNSTTFETEPQRVKYSRHFEFKQINVENNEGNNHKKYTVSTNFGIGTRFSENEISEGEYIFSDKLGQNVILNKDLTKAYLEGIVEINIPQAEKK